MQTKDEKREEELIDLLKRANGYIGKISDTTYSGSLNLYIEIEQFLEEVERLKNEN